jgi:hypothetical protein
MRLKGFGLHPNESKGVVALKPIRDGNSSHAVKFYRKF